MSEADHGRVVPVFAGSGGLEQQGWDVSAAGLPGLGAAGADAVVLTVRGELDMVTVPALRTALAPAFVGRLDPEGALPGNGATDSPTADTLLKRPASASIPVCAVVVLDLAAVTFLSSSGLGLLVDASRVAAQHTQSLRVVTGDNRVVTRSLTIMGLETALAVFVELDAALTATGHPER